MRVDIVVRANNSGLTALHLAAENDCLKTVEAILAIYKYDLLIYDATSRLFTLLFRKENSLYEDASFKLNIDQQDVSGIHEPLSER